MITTVISYLFSILYISSSYIYTIILGFPATTYAPHLTYPAPTDLKLADRVAELLTSNGETCKKENRGFDHGVFIPLKLAVPDANIPIVQLSLHSSLDFERHVKLGEMLSPLRDEGVLIVCSGQTTHNLVCIHLFLCF
jgi:aromatic ring-opening dioxygenase catalytic subunit (LigB family)